MSSCMECQSNSNILKCSKCGLSFCKNCIQKFYEIPQSCPFNCLDPKFIGKDGKEVSFQENISPSIMSQSTVATGGNFDWIRSIYHNCRLKLIETETPWRCNHCKNKYIKGKKSYNCNDCNYNLCKTCQFEENDLKKYVKKTGWKDLKSKFDAHRLLYIERDKPWNCEACKKQFPGQYEKSYTCFACEFDLCEQCKDSEGTTDNVEVNSTKITTVNHIHGLKETYPTCPWICNMCNTFFPKETKDLRCNECDFDLCENCLHKKTKVINSKYHYHDLKFLEHGGPWKCNICNVILKPEELAYYCPACDFNLCQKCKDEEKHLSLKSITSKYHEHDLLLTKLKVNNGWSCNICKKTYDWEKSSYNCFSCPFTVCTNCREDEWNNHVEVKYQSDHDHTLTLKTQKGSWKCYTCNKEFEAKDPTFCCEPCSFYICWACKKLNEQFAAPDIFISILHEHALYKEGYNNSDFLCKSCGKIMEAEKNMPYFCKGCNYCMCSSCKKDEETRDGDKSMTYFFSVYHKHPTKLVISAKKWECIRCEKNYPANVATYECSKCNVEICKECKFKEENELIKNPPQLYRSKYHSHQLKTLKRPDGFICNSCGKKFRCNTIFCCWSCGYNVCEDCMTKERKVPILAGTFLSQKHPDNLLLLQLKNEWKCSNCKRNFPTISMLFRCKNCNYNLCQNCRNTEEVGEVALCSCYLI